MPTLVVVGSANLDLVVRTQRLPAPGETLLGSSFQTYPGGKGANQAVAAARLGGDVVFVARVGDDGFATSLRQSLTDAGVSLDHVLSTPGSSSGVAAISVDDQGQNCILVAPGANALLTPHDVREALSRVETPRVVLVQLETPLDTVRETLRLGKELGAITVLNPAPAQPLSEIFFKTADWITPNETEAESLTGVKPQDPASAKACGRLLLAKGVANALITLGKGGSVHVSASGATHFPAFSVDAVDTTAAGDAFSGALALALARGQAAADSIRFATRVAALSTTRSGAQASMPSEADLASLGPDPEPVVLA